MKQYSRMYGQPSRVIAVVLIWICGGTITGALAQEVQINEDPRVSQLCRNWINDNRANPHVEGWRVQIMATPDRQQVEEARNRFRIAHPEVPAEWTQEKPYYKLRVGAFRNKLDAMAFIAVLTDYPGAYPAKDGNIHPRDFID